MPTQEATEYYYDKGKEDGSIGFYEQPFPSPMQMDLDEFELLCNKAYKKGFADATEFSLN